MSEIHKLRVSVLGLGKMGSAIADNILKAGYPVTVWNRSPGKARPFLDRGVAVAATPREAAAAADIVISSLYDEQSILSILNGDDGLIAGLRPGAIHVGTSTVSADAAERFAQRHAESGCLYLAGPVLGRVTAARKGQLITFIGGDAAGAETVRGVITAYAPMMIHVSDRPGDASLAKLTGNFIAVAMLLMVGETLAFAERTGAGQTLAVQLLTGLFGAEPAREYVKLIAEREFDDAGFTTEGGLKDVGLMIDAARRVGLRLSIAESARDKLEDIIARGFGGRDWSCFTDVDRPPIEAGAPSAGYELAG